ncbi:hypothetical protein Tco_0573178 [Tanacetum coccineum]
MNKLSDYKLRTLILTNLLLRLSKLRLLGNFLRSFKGDIVNIVANSSVNVHSSVAMNDSVNYVENCNKCLELEAELIKQHNMVEKDEYNRLSKSFSKLEQHCISLELAVQLNKEIFQKNNTSVNQTEPTFDHLFELNSLKAELQAKDTTIQNIKNDLRKLKGKDIVDNAAQVLNATTSAPVMYKLDHVTLAPKDKNNRETHIYYLKHTMEQAAILREILLGYVRDTFPDIHKPSEKLVAVTPINKKKTVTSMFDARHELCFLEFVSDMNARRTFTLVGNACPLTRITTTNIVTLREPIPLEVIAQESVVTKVYTRRNMVVQIVLWYLDSGCSKHMTRDRSQLTNFVHKFLGTVKFGNDQIAKIMGYDLEVAFRLHTCFVRNLEGVDLLSGS